MEKFYCLPQKIRYLRIQHKITLTVLAQYTGISRNTLYLIEAEFLNVNQKILEKILDDIYEVVGVDFINPALTLK